MVGGVINLVLFVNTGNKSFLVVVIASIIMIGVIKSCFFILFFRLMMC